MRAHLTHITLCRLAALALLLPALPAAAAGPVLDFIAHSNQDGWVLHSNQDPGPVPALTGGTPYDTTRELILADRRWPEPEAAPATLESIESLDGTTRILLHGNSPATDDGSGPPSFDPGFAPVPAPAAAPLLVLGALAMGTRRRRDRRE